MKLALTVWERETLRSWLGSASKGNIAFVRCALRILDKLELTAEECKAVNYRRMGNAVRWDDTEHVFALSFDAQEMAILRTACTWEGWPATRLHLEMLEKLEQAGS